MTIVKEALIEELQKGIKNSTDYKTKIESSKTRTKEDFYKKKLHRTNDLNMKMMMALQRLEDKEKKDEHTSNDGE